MPWLTCLICGALSRSSRCPIHRSANARGYGYPHQIRRKELIKLQPFCTHCFHMVDPDTGSCGMVNCERCPLQLDHVIALGTKRIDRGFYQILCRKCNRAKGTD